MVARDPHQSMTTGNPRRPGKGPAGHHPRSLWLPLAAASIAVSIAGAGGGCATTAGGVPATATAQPSTVEVSITFGGTDRAWIQLMIPMNEQLLKALELVPDHGADPRTREFAGRIAAARRAELAELIRLRERAGLEPGTEHDGHDLPGIVTPDDLAALRDAAFDRGIRQTLREYLEQGARLAAAERASGTDPETRQLAERIHAARTAELGALPG
jgi:uncharacterized protein (DUF305 family)